MQIHDDEALLQEQSIQWIFPGSISSLTGSDQSPYERPVVNLVYVMLLVMMMSHFSLLPMTTKDSFKGRTTSFT